MSKTLSLTRTGAPRPFASLLLYAVAAALHATSRGLTRLASSLAAERTLSAPTLHLPVVEFHPVHRDAGAPEGALYVDGELVGYLPPGVTRL